MASLERGLDILEYMALSSTPTSLDHISCKLQMPRTSCFRILKALQQKGYIQLAKTTGREQRWELTSKLRIFADVVEEEMSLRTIAGPHMRILADNTDLFVQLGILTNDKVMYIDDVKRSKALRVYAAKWSLLDFHACAAGLVLAAHLPKEQLEDMIERQGLPQKTQHTITDKSALLAKLGEIREVRFAIDEEYYASGIKCVASPIFDRKGVCAAAVGVTGHSEELGKVQFIIDEVRVCAEHISKELGYEPAN